MSPYKITYDTLFCLHHLVHQKNTFTTITGLVEHDEEIWVSV